MDLFDNTITDKEALGVSALAFAYVGDAVYEIIIRNYLITKFKEMNAHKLHVKATEYVKAKAQCEFMKSIMEYLTEDEMAVFKRGRNAKSYTSPKNADITDYRMATGFEALIGYLYITGRKNRINELLNYVVK
ncbi:ribonuclease-3 family protein [Hathewaya proteolytica DSM 3090]|uniref:Mini-ribonuclease 3 n=1 Tax=Hathewaya proteolytica DSM 3090 TaxID=1121331 RepID=A0A1M6T5H2_9CLOT|nr:ribonuclease III domain-containing protein [Hathewaya proteolytica]SHK52217.1 ribonuclease-3 family protein [Hathewaya proteolytica DSM 3090]